MSRPRANQNLLRKDRVWLAVIEVPKALRPVIGKARFKRSLGTEDVQVARLKRDRVVAEMREQIEAARRGKLTVASGGADLQTALALRKQIADAEYRVDDDNGQAVYDLKFEAGALAEEVEKRAGEVAALAFVGIAQGTATPVDLYLEDFLREKDYTERTKFDHRHSMKALRGWLEAARKPATIEAISDKLASAFKTEALVAKRVNSKTANKLLSCLRAYWRWLIANGHSERNPWLNKSLPKPRAGTTEEGKERPFTDAELVKLLTGDADETLLDAMYCAALSGMRIDELFQLRAKHCTGGTFKIAAGKSAAAIRDVPIHPGLKAIVERRLEGKDVEDFLFEDGSRGGWGTSRSMAISKRFTYYRRKLGINPVVEGKRRALVNFHSFRRWFITKADQAGCRREDVERVVGHKAEGMSYGHYSGGMKLEQRFAVVVSVKLPVHAGARMMQRADTYHLAKVQAARPRRVKPARRKAVVALTRRPPHK